MVRNLNPTQEIYNEVDDIIDDARERFCVRLDSLAAKFQLSDTELIEILKYRQGESYAADFKAYTAIGER